MHNVLERSRSKDGYLLLGVLWSYLTLDMYASMDVHTSETIARGRKELVEYEKALKVESR